MGSPWPGPTTMTTPVGPPVMPVNIRIPGPVDPALMADVRAACVKRQTEIEAELATMGVTNPPAVRTTPPARDTSGSRPAA